MHSITSKHPDFKALEFAARAVSKGSTRPQLTLLKIENGGELAIGLDGRRLHEARLVTGTLTDGTYRILKRTKTLLWLVPDDGDGLAYPNWRQVRCKSTEGRLEGTFKHAEKKPLTVGWSGLFCRVLHRLTPADGYDFVKFCEAMPPAGVKFFLACKGPLNPLVMKSTDGAFRSVLMGVRL